MAKTIPTDQLPTLLKHLELADSVELKVTVPDQDTRSVAAALGMDPIEGEIRQVVFFDTPDLTLSKAGVVVRARRVQGGAGDSVIKLRPIDPEDLPGLRAQSKDLGVEVDAIPGAFVCSASLKSKSSAKEVRSAILGAQPISSLFSKKQRALYEAHAPKGLALDDLAILGPILVLKLKFAHPELSRGLVAELWLYPDGTRILELSTKCETGETFQAAAEVRAFLHSKGVNLEGDQATKTKTALEYFAGLRRAS